MKQLEEFHKTCLERLVKSRKFALTAEPIDYSKRFRIFTPWPAAFDVETILPIFEAIKTPIFVTYGTRARTEVEALSNPAAPQRVSMCVNIEDVCGRIVSVVIDSQGFSADCVASGPKAELLLALRDTPDCVVPRLRITGHLLTREVEKFIGIDLDCRTDDNPGLLSFHNQSKKTEFFIREAQGWEDPKIVRTVVRHPWPTNVDPNQALEVAREQFGGRVVKDFPRLVRRVDPKKEPHEPVLQEELRGRCTMTNITTEGLEFEFTLEAPHAVRLKGVLENCPVALSALPFIVLDETGNVLRFGDVFIVENMPNVISAYPGAPNAVFGTI